MALLKTALVHLDAAVRHGSIRKAAESLNVSSSAMNRQLLQLEQEVGVELFERLPRGIRPTAAGGVLLAYVRRWQRESSLLRQEIGSLAGGIRGTIRIAAAEGFTQDLLPNAMARLQTRFPHVNYTLISGDNQRITNELLAREADLVIAYDVSDHVRAQRVHTFIDPIGIITAPDHPLSQRDTLRLGDIAESPLIAPGDDWLRHSGLRYLFDNDRAPGRVIAKAERPSILKALVRHGLGIAFFSQVGAEKDVSEGKLAWIPLEKGIIEPTRISVLLPLGRIQPVYTMEFVEHIKQDLIDYKRVNPFGDRGQTG